MSLSREDPRFLLPVIHSLVPFSTDSSCGDSWLPDRQKEGLSWLTMTRLYLVLSECWFWRGTRSNTSILVSSLPSPGGGLSCSRSSALCRHQKGGRTQGHPFFLHLPCSQPQDTQILRGPQETERHVPLLASTGKMPVQGAVSRST